MAKRELDGYAIGKRIILPWNFIGSPRNMREKYVDAMALVKTSGKPGYFIYLF